MSYERKRERDRGKKLPAKKRNCRFCQDKDLVIDYKNTRLLADFLTERGKIIGRRVTGNSCYHQRLVVQAIKRARHLALLPYTITHAVRD